MHGTRVSSLEQAFLTCFRGSGIGMDGAGGSGLGSIPSLSQAVGGWGCSLIRRLAWGLGPGAPLLTRLARVAAGSEA